jgi:hypothetical protein
MTKPPTYWIRQGRSLDQTCAIEHEDGLVDRVVWVLCGRKVRVCRTSGRTQAWFAGTASCHLTAVVARRIGRILVRQRCLDSCPAMSRITKI